MAKSNFVGKFLISSPQMRDPNFAESVILIIKHDPEAGALGVVVNRTSEDSLQEMWDHIWDVNVEHSEENQKKFMQLGGPVFGPIISVHENEPNGEGKIASGLFYAVHPDKVLGAIGTDARIRLYQGYSGWAGGQLEAEIDKGAWMVIDADPEIVFYEQHEDRNVYKDALYKFGNIVYRNAAIDIPLNSDVLLN